jgi:hypothetical protein
MYVSSMRLLNMRTSTPTEGVDWKRSDLSVAAEQVPYNYTVARVAGVKP